jgi:hypothetical protein
MNRKKFTLLLLPILIILGCQKKFDIPDEPTLSKTGKKNVPPKGFFIENRKVPGVALTNNAPNQRASTANASSRQSSSPDLDNGDVPIVLGQQLANPYTVANMQQAVNVLYGGNYPISATHLYVRFKPSSVEQLMTLEETEDLELQNYPMDYEVVQDGDYYQDPNLGTEEFGWLYTVVQVGYNFPAGIQNEIIDSLYLPEDNLVLEEMAESMAAGGQYQSTSSESGTVTIQRTDTTMESFSFDPEPCGCDPYAIECVPNPGCESGGGGGGGGNDPRIPRGTIQVQDMSVCSGPITDAAVRQARIVCKRWFKIDRTYTNDQGQFVSSKRFNNKVKVNLKTKNNHAIVRKVRGIRLWQMLFPVKRRIGVFDQGAMAGITHLIRKPSPTAANDPELPYWVAATTHNSVLEYRQYATEFGIGQPPASLKILVTNWGFQRGAGAAPMWNKCSSLSSDFSTFQEYIEFFIAMSTYVTQANLFGFLKNQMDVVIGYAATNGDYDCRLTSASVRSIAYHELGHASHYAQAGCDYWQAYRVRIANELITSFGADPYGDGTETNAGVVAVGEMWGNHCEKLFSERHYANPLRETFSTLQGIFVNDGSPILNYAGVNTRRVAGLNANFAAIESFNPNINIDPHWWIPQGLSYDLFDNRNDIAFPNGTVVDNVFGYTAQQSFNALQGDVRTVPAFRDRLLLQNGNNQAAAVTDLIFRYGY